jgi:hypothetical protein
MVPTAIGAWRKAVQLLVTVLSVEIILMTPAPWRLAFGSVVSIVIVGDHIWICSVKRQQWAVVEKWAVIGGSNAYSG